MYLEDNDIENLYEEFRNESATPPAEAKAYVMGNIGHKSYWRFMWMFLFLIGVGISAFLLFPVSNSNDNQNGVANDQKNKTLSNSFGLKDQNEKFSPLSSESNNEIDQENAKGDKTIEVKNNNTKNDLNSVKSTKSVYSKKKKNDDVKSNKKYNQKFLSKNDIKKVEVNKKEDNSLLKENDKNFKNTAVNGKQNLEFSPKEANNDVKIQDQNIGLTNMEVNEIETDQLTKLNGIKSSDFAFKDSKGMHIEIRNMKKQKLLSFGVEAQVGYSFSDVLSQKDQVTYDNIGMLKNINTVEAGINGILNYQSFLFKIGVRYQKDYTTTDYTDEVYLTRTTVAYEELLDSNNNPYHSTVATFVDTELVSNNYQLLISTSYFNVPLKFGYQFRLRNRWNIELMAGTRLAFLTGVDSRYRSPNSMDYLQSIDHGAFRKFRIDGTIDMGINYQLTENWGIGMNLPFSIGLNSRIKESKILNYRIGGLLNLRYNF
jgi:hypothetical protein